MRNENSPLKRNKNEGELKPIIFNNECSDLTTLNTRFRSEFIESRLDSSNHQTPLRVKRHVNDSYIQSVKES
jgi:hypothetical protein